MVRPTFAIILKLLSQVLWRKIIPEKKHGAMLSRRSIPSGQGEVIKSEG